MEKEIDFKIEYEKLHQIAKLLGIEFNEYREAIKGFNKDVKEACKIFLGFEDIDNEVENFQTFFFYYIAEHLEKSYFHNNNSKMFTKGLQKLLKDSGNLLDNKIDFNDFEQKEKTYDDVLIDILASNIEYELKKINKTIFAISMGLNSCIYVITDYKILKELKKVDSKLVQIFDTLNLEKIYGYIYQFKENDQTFNNILVKGDYIMEDKENKGKYISLFNPNVRQNIVITFLTEEQKKNLKVVL